MIYKYTTYKWLPDIIYTNSLHFSCPLDFNDPFDSFIRMKKIEDYTKDDIEKLINEAEDENKKKKLIDVFYINQINEQKLLEERKKEVDKIFLVLSLSELKDNILMWSHYAELHKGFCIGFKSNIDDIDISKDSEPNDKEILSKLKGKNFLLFEEECFKSQLINHLNNESLNTEYADIGIASKIFSRLFNKKLLSQNLENIDYPKYNTISDAFDYFRCNYTNDNNKQTELGKIGNFLKTKSNLWGYEEEKRIIIAYSDISKNKCPNNNIKFEKSLLKEIIFGVRTPEVHKLCIRSLVEKMGYENVEFYQAERKDDKYELDIKKI